MLTTSGYKCGLLTIKVGAFATLANLFSVSFSRLLTRYSAVTVNIHYHETRRPNQLNYFLPRVNKSACQNKLDNRGVKLWNETKDELKTRSL